jgi:hypothetical protein
MEPENKQDYESLQSQLNAQQQALAQIYKSVEKTRKYIFWTGVMNIIVFVLPLILVVVALPRIISTFTSSLGGFSGGDSSSPVELLSEPSLRQSLENLKNLGM